jgi:hypothetical protein
MAKDARFGHEYVLPKGRDALKRMFTFGFAAAPWESLDYPELDAAGRFEAEMFDPERWKSNYPNPAFLSRQPDDEYWAAKLVVAFTDEEIRAVVETGGYTDPAVTDWITRTLIARRDEIGRVYFNKVLALDRFRIERGELRFDDLRAAYGFGPPRRFELQWHRYDNVAGEAKALEAETSAALPALNSPYLMVRIHEAGDRGKAVRVWVRRRDGRVEVVGIERRAPDRG